jgi:hypothetical protein
MPQPTTQPHAPIYNTEDEKILHILHSVQFNVRLIPTAAYGKDPIHVPYKVGHFHYECGNKHIHLITLEN